jgi:flagellar biogenesis protein FliO
MGALLGRITPQKWEMAWAVLSGFWCCCPIGVLLGRTELIPKPAVINYIQPTPTAATSAMRGVSVAPFLAQLGGETAQAVNELPLETGLPGVDMTRYALVCLGLVVAILGLAWGFRKVVSGNIRGRASRRAMKVVDILPLGGKRQLAVVRCYDRTFVLGLGERDVTLISELDAEEDVEGHLAVQTLAQPTNKEEAATELEVATAPPKAGLFSSILSSARTGLARQVDGSTPRPIKAALPQAAAHPPEPTAKLEPVKSEETKQTSEKVSGGGWIG